MKKEDKKPKNEKKDKLTLEGGRNLKPILSPYKAALKEAWGRNTK